MNAIRERLASGRRWWAAEIVLRGLGLGCLAMAACAALRIHALVIASGRQSTDPVEFLECLGVVLLFSAGLALVCHGPGLFGRVPRPPRALLP